MYALSRGRRDGHGKCRFALKVAGTFGAFPFGAHRAEKTPHARGWWGESGLTSARRDFELNVHPNLDSGAVAVNAVFPSRNLSSPARRECGRRAAKSMLTASSMKPNRSPLHADAASSAGVRSRVQYYCVTWQLKPDELIEL